MTAERRALILVDERLGAVWFQVRQIHVQDVQDVITSQVMVDGKLLPQNLTVAGRLVTEAQPKNDACAICSKSGAMQPYSVHDEVWLGAGLRKDQVTHIWCLEQVLGRRVCAADLKDCGWNDFVKHVMA